jgi:hypothetical protein
MNFFPQRRALAEQIYEQSLSPDEVTRRLAAARGDVVDEAEARSLIAWFCRRYPNPIDRMRYARRMYLESTRIAAID